MNDAMRISVLAVAIGVLVGLTILSLLSMAYVGLATLTEALQ